MKLKEQNKTKSRKYSADYCKLFEKIAQSAGVEEYTDCTTAER